MWWPLGLDFAQAWRVEGASLVPDSPLYKMSDALTRIEVTPNRFKRVPMPIEPYKSAVPFKEASQAMQEDIVHGKRVKFQRNPKYAKGTDKLAADGKNGLAHHTEFQRPDGKWVAVRDNLLNPHYYYAAVKDRLEDDYPPAIRTNLFGQAMPVAGNLPDGRPWIICNNAPRTDMYLTLSDDGVTFDRTWLLLHIDRQTDGGVCKGSHGGPQYFQAVTVGPQHLGRLQRCQGAGRYHQDPPDGPGITLTAWAPPGLRRRQPAGSCVVGLWGNTELRARLSWTWGVFWLRLARSGIPTAHDSF